MPWLGLTDYHRTAMVTRCPESFDEQAIRGGIAMPAIGALRPLTWFWLVALVALTGVGCQSMPELAEPPVGPGAASAADLSPWLAGAREVTCTAYLQHMWVHGDRGSYLTWAIHPVLDYDGAEVDIRQCAQAAGQLNEKEVVIRGRLIDRGEDHLPLLVAEEIRPYLGSIARNSRGI
jgi:hypothetical protein